MGLVEQREDFEVVHAVEFADHDGCVLEDAFGQALEDRIFGTFGIELEEVDLGDVQFFANGGGGSDGKFDGLGVVATGVVESATTEVSGIVGGVVLEDTFFSAESAGDDGGAVTEEFEVGAEEVEILRKRLERDDLSIGVAFAKVEGRHTDVGTDVEDDPG